MPWRHRRSPYHSCPSKGSTTGPADSHQKVCCMCVSFVGRSAVHAVHEHRVLRRHCRGACAVKFHQALRCLPIVVSEPVTSACNITVDLPSGRAVSVHSMAIIVTTLFRTPGSTPKSAATHCLAELAGANSILLHIRNGKLTPC